MNGQIPPRHLCEFLLPANLQYVPDVLVVGTQETFPEKTEWEVKIVFFLRIMSWQQTLISNFYVFF